MKYTEIVNGEEVVMSPPARGAWIEIAAALTASLAWVRRPPHGGRGLKCLCQQGGPGRGESPPARGAWIEIFV